MASLLDPALSQPGNGLLSVQMQMHPYDMLPLFAGPSDMGETPPPPPPPPPRVKDWLDLMLDKRQPDATVDPRLEVKPPDPRDYLRDRLPFMGRQHVPRPWTET
jgi:hypothetical protein